MSNGTIAEPTARRTKAVEADGRVRSPLPAPEVLPPPPSGGTAGSIPCDPFELYEAAGASDALQHLERLTGVSCRELPPLGKPVLHKSAAAGVHRHDAALPSKRLLMEAADTAGALSRCTRYSCCHDSTRRRGSGNAAAVLLPRRQRSQSCVSFSPGQPPHRRRRPQS